MAKYNQVGGFKEVEMEEIRRLKGELQAEMPGENINAKGAIMWAVQNELERREL